MSEHKTYFIDELASLQPGQAIRLLPFGTLVKSGRKREITPDLAALFKLPHFRPPLKLGSHNDETPAGGFITGLYVGDDGLYGNVELTDKGARALTEGDYRYHSPEIIWEGGGLEDPSTGALIDGPLIVGDALLHTPHLGEAAALYTIEIKDNSMDEQEILEELEEVTAPVGFWEKFAALFKRAESPEADEDAELEHKEQEPMEELNAAVDADEFAALQQERDQYAAELAQMKAEQEHKALVDQFGARLAETKAGPELAEVLAKIDADAADAVLDVLKALSAQIDDTQLTAEVGSAGEGTPANPVEKLATFINQKQQEGLSYSDAYRAISKENPDLVAQIYK